MTESERPIDDSAAWIRAALTQYERPLTAYATRILGDVERARDAVQETFLRLCNQERASVENHLSEWLFRVCRNQALDVQRKESWMTPMNEDRERVALDTAPPPTAAIEARENLSHVLGMMSGLPAKQQEVLRLKFQHGLSYKEISRVMDESIGNVGWLIHVGIKNLRGKLAGEGAEA
ncbi:MAG: sigma-70 family RNA polymerase sigma factor [bacterium]|nr:sigma-70 family RNA polymerase sigma factor [bacterium]